jgi:hypothetical protein
VSHDWDDDRSAAILTNCQRTGRNGRVLVVETVMCPHNRPSFDKLIDLNMPVTSGGRDCSEAESRVRFDTAGLRLTKILPTLFPLSLIEGVRSAN